jgi:hypothetical protein
MSEEIAYNLIRTCVKIEGDKDGFNSKSAIEKFKVAVKSNNLNLEDLSKKFIKPDYTLELVTHQNNEYTFLIKKLKTEIVNNTDDKKEKLRAKLNKMNQFRTNWCYNKAKMSSIVPANILSEYKKLVKISNVPIPEPEDILSNPGKYKEIISMVLNNNMAKNLPQSHPYIKYFKLLAVELGIDQTLPIPTKDFLNKTSFLPDNLDKMIDMSGPITNIRGNDISKSEETDSD